VDNRGNQDGWVCINALNTPDQAPPNFVIIDDQVQ